MQTTNDQSELRKGVAESFNVYQATIAMMAIFSGFVFSGLLQLLTRTEAFNVSWRVVVWLLTASMVLVTSATMCFHATSHAVLRYWRTFYPTRMFSRLGPIRLERGCLAMKRKVGSAMNTSRPLERQLDGSGKARAVSHGPGVPGGMSRLFRTASGLAANSGRTQTKG